MSIVYDTVVSSGQSFYVSAPTSAYFTTAYYYGYQFVYGGGFAFETILSGGIEYVWSGGSDADSFVYSGGEEYAYGGGETETPLIYSGGELYVGSGGYAEQAAIFAGGSGYTEADGQDHFTTVDSGGVQYIYGYSYNDTIGQYGSQTIELGGYSFEADVIGGQLVYGGGSAYYASALNAGSEQTIYGGIAYSTVLSNGGEQYVALNGLGWETFVYSGGNQTIGLDGTGYATQVGSGGTESTEFGRLRFRDLCRPRRRAICLRRFLPGRDNLHRQPVCRVRRLCFRDRRRRQRIRLRRRRSRFRSRLRWRSGPVWWRRLLHKSVCRRRPIRL